MEFDTPTLSTALAAFQAELPRIRKENTARITSEKRSFTYTYADLAAVSAVVLPALARHGLSWTSQPTLTDDGTFVLHYQLRHTSGECLEGRYPLPSATSGPQVLGSALTYARRYCLCAVTGVSPDDDDDDAAVAQDLAAVLGTDWEPAIRECVARNDLLGLKDLWAAAAHEAPNDQGLRDRLLAAADKVKGHAGTHPSSAAIIAAAPPLTDTAADDTRGPAAEWDVPPGGKPQ